MTTTYRPPGFEEEFDPHDIGPLPPAIDAIDEELEAEMEIGWPEETPLCPAEWAPWADGDEAIKVPSRPAPPGMIMWRLEEVMRARGLVNDKGPFKGRVNLSAIVRGSGLATSTLYPLLRDPGSTKGILLSTLVRLCWFLRCTPGDLLEFIPDTHAPDTAIADRADPQRRDTPVPHGSRRAGSRQPLNQLERLGMWK